MNRVEELIAETKLKELLNKKEEEKPCKAILWTLAIIGYRPAHISPLLPVHHTHETPPY